MKKAAVVLTLILMSGCGEQRVRIGNLKVRATEGSPVMQPPTDTSNAGNSNDQDQSPDPDNQILKATYESLNKQIFVPKCIRCHATGRRLVPLDTHEAITDPDNELINFDVPEQSLIYQVVSTTNPDDIMPPVRTGLPALTSEELFVLKTWIANGAPK